MKIILLKDVKKLGKAGEIKNVSDGYAKNFLIPRKLAEIATESKIKEIKNLEKIENHRREQEQKKLKEIVEKINERSFTIKVKAGDSGKLFGSLTAEKISSILKERADVNIDKRKIQMKPIRELGKYDIVVDFKNDFKAIIHIFVEKEDDA